MGNMSFLSFRELRTSTAKISDMLKSDGKIVVTNNGKPKAIMISVDDSDLEETLAILSQARLAKAIRNIRITAQRNGASEMTFEEINKEIAQARKEKRALQTKGGANA